MHRSVHYPDCKKVVPNLFWGGKCYNPEVRVYHVWGGHSVPEALTPASLPPELAQSLRPTGASH